MIRRIVPRVIVSKRVHFNAAHRLHNPALSDQENSELYGLCNNPNFHGHNYELEISVEGEIDARTGYVADLGAIKRVVKQTVVDRFDHKNLNLDVAEFSDTIPSAENISVVIWELLVDRLPAKLVRVTLWETPRNVVIYEGR